jgi:hypothetical protein
MKLDVRERALTVAMAEAACLQAHIGRVDAERELKSEFIRVATPLRIVGSGFVLGVTAGLLPTKTKTTKTGPLGQLMSLAMDTVVPSLLAGMTAAQSAGEVAGEVAGEEIEAATETIAEDVAERVVEEGIAEDMAAEEPKRGRRKRT